jgi:hypothetical protein
MTDLSSSYDLFLASAVSYIQFEWPGGECRHGSQVCSFLEAWICLLTCEAVTRSLRKGTATPSVLEDNCFLVWGPSSISGNCFVLKSRYVIGLCWLHNDFGCYNQPTGDEIIWEWMSSFQILLGYEATLQQDVCRRDLATEINRN